MSRPSDRNSSGKFSKPSRESDESGLRRVARVEKEVQIVVSEYIIRYLKDELPGLVTVGRVMIPGDLRSAKVFVSLLDPTMADDTALIKKMLHVLKSHAKQMQTEISRKIQMKYLPKIEFSKDDSTEKILKVENMLKSLSVQSSKNKEQKN